MDDGSGDKRKQLGTVSVYAAGVCTSAALWLLIDAHVVQRHDGVRSDEAIEWYHYLPISIGIISLFILTSIPIDAIQASPFSGANTSVARLYLFVSMSLVFGCAIAAVWMGVARWLAANLSVDSKWPGIALIIQASLLVAAALLWRFARPAKEGLGAL